MVHSNGCGEVRPIRSGSLCGRLVDWCNDRNHTFINEPKPGTEAGNERQLWKFTIMLTPIAIGAGKNGPTMSGNFSCFFLPLHWDFLWRTNVNIISNTKGKGNMFKVLLKI